MSVEPPPLASAPGVLVSRGAAPRLRALPAAWLLLTAYVLGGVRIAGILRDGFASYPIATGLAVAVFAAYAVPFLLLIRAVDYLEREPPSLQILAVLWGGLVATSAAISGGAAVQDLMAKVGSPRLAAAWGPAVSGALVEELLKVSGVVAIALLAPRQINSMVDGFVYGALVGLGFQVVENVVFAVGAVSADPDPVRPVLATFVVRGLLAGLWSHTLFTALTGAGVAYVMLRRDRPAGRRAGVAALLFLAAAGFHFLWNSPVLAGAGVGALGLAALMVLKGVPALFVGATLIVVAERREADYYAGLLAGVADPRIATPEEVVTLISPLRRVAARRRARARLGWAGSRAVRRLQRAQAGLAVALVREAAPQLIARRREVLIRRHHLLALEVRRRHLR